jgi:hypothetical protein
MGTKRAVSIIGIIGLLALGAACGSSSGGIPGLDAAPGFPDAAPLPPGPDGAITGSNVVGAGGGTVTSGAWTISIPRHALDHDVTIGIADNAGAVTGAASPMVQISPADTRFAIPATLTYSADGGSSPALFWAQDGSNFEEVGEGTSVQIVRLGSGYIAESTGHRTIYGVVYHQFNHGSSFTNVGRDFSRFAVNALIPSGSSYTVVAGAATNDGLIVIPGVPVGRAVIQVGGRYLDTSASVIDLTTATLGRPDASPPGTYGNFVMNLDNLESWTSGDDLELYSPDADTWYFGIMSNPPPGAPGDGATSVSGLTIAASAGHTSSGDPANLIDGSKGDHAAIVQLAARATNDGVPFLTLAREANFGSFTEADGSSTNLSAAMTEVAQHDVSVSMKGSQFAGLAVGPGQFSGGQFIVSVEADPDDGLGFTATPDSMIAQFSGDDLSLSGASYGVPSIASGWTVFGEAVYYHVFSAGPTALYTSGVVVDSLDSFASNGVRPPVSPVQNVKIGGKDASLPAIAVGTTPSVTWDAPASGDGGVYLVWLFSVDSGGLTNLAEFVTANHGVAIPPGLIASGKTYIIEIDAMQGFSLDGLTHVPSRWAKTPYGTATFTP